MVSCAIADCTTTHRNNPNKYSFHRFPSNPEVRQQWIKIVNRPNWTPKKTAYVCSKHFEESNFIWRTRQRALVKMAIPTKLVPVQLTPPITSLNTTPLTRDTESPVIQYTSKKKRALLKSSLDAASTSGNASAPCITNHVSVVAGPSHNVSTLSSPQKCGGNIKEVKSMPPKRPITSLDTTTLKRDIAVIQYICNNTRVTTVPTSSFEGTSTSAPCIIQYVSEVAPLQNVSTLSGAQQHGRNVRPRFPPPPGSVREIQRKEKAFIIKTKKLKDKLLAKQRLIKNLRAQKKRIIDKLLQYHKLLEEIKEYCCPKVNTSPAATAATSSAILGLVEQADAINFEEMASENNIE